MTAELKRGVHSTSQVKPVLGASDIENERREETFHFSCDRVDGRLRRPKKKKKLSNKKNDDDFCEWSSSLACLVGVGVVGLVICQ